VWNREESRSSRQTDPPVAASGVSTHRPTETEEKREANIGRSVFVKGELTASEDLTVDGCVEGRIDLHDHELIIWPNARIHAVLVAKVVTVFGTVVGDITALERVEIRRSGSVQGNLTCPRIAIQDGAHFCGRVDTGARGRAQHGAETRKAVPTLVAV
jgi:cytoskeletal protein CcmA (bactofilin family)